MASPNGGRSAAGQAIIRIMLVALAVMLQAGPDVAALQSVLDHSESKSPAVSVAVVKDGKILFCDGKGANPDSEYRIASLTKAFTAMVILQLSTEKKLSLDAAIGTYLPSLPKPWQEATIRQIVHHISGIPSYTSEANFVAKIGEQLTPAQIVERTATKPLRFAPGSRYEYSNTGYAVLGMLAEKLDRRPFADSLNRRIFRPLGMKRSRLDQGGKTAESRGFDAKGKPALGINMSQPYAAGSIVSTAHDMALWLAALGSDRLLPKPQWATVFEAGRLADGKAGKYAFGWIISDKNGVLLAIHEGGIPGFSTCAAYVPSLRLGAVVLTNGEGSDPDKLCNLLLETADSSLKFPPSGIADTDPKITEATRLLVTSLGTESPDMAKFSADLASKITAEFLLDVKSFIAGSGALTELRLISIKGDIRTYVAIWEKKLARVSVMTDETGKFSYFLFTPA